MSNKLDRDHLVPGAIVMVGPSRLPGGGIDRSWTDAIWRVLASTGDAILCQRATDLVGYADVPTLRYPDHAWFAAEHMLEAYNTALAETKAAYDAKRASDRDREKPASAPALGGVISSSAI